MACCHGVVGRTRLLSLGNDQAAVVVDHLVESGEDLFAVHPMKTAAHGDQPEVTEIAGEIC